MSDDEQEYSINCSLGRLSLTVRGPDEEWVEETFEENWKERLRESSEMKEAIRQADVSTQ